MKTAPDYWYDSSRKIPLFSRLLSGVYGFVSEKRRKYYQRNERAVYHAPIPVIVVGNINVGGTGKTPVSIALISHLKSQGYQPALISRGYGGKADQFPQIVKKTSQPRLVGDEPVLIAQRTSIPVIVDPNRKRGIQTILESFPDVNVVISDDGLQHYAMGRDIEIVVIDGNRRFGNKRLLPAGPLREEIKRKDFVDFCICNGSQAEIGEYQMSLDLKFAISLDGVQTKPLAEFVGVKVHAIAGIGNPQRFFNGLEAQGLEVITHPFADHYPFTEKDCIFEDDLPVLMTEKDAVKCNSHNLSNTWVIPAETHLPAEFYIQFDKKLQSIQKVK